MPTAPRQDRRLQRQPLPGAPAGRVVSQEKFLQAGAAAGSVGAAAARLSTDTLAIWEREQTRARTILLREFDIRFRGLSDRLRLSASELKGKDAVFADLAGEMARQGDKEFEDMTKDVSDPKTIEGLRLAWAGYRQGNFSYANDHQSKEREAWDVETFNTHQLGSMDSFATAGFDDPEKADEIMEFEMASIDAYGRDNGWSKEKIKLEKGRFKSAAHVGVLKRLDSQGRDMDVSAYYKEHKKDLTADDRTANGKWVAQSSRLSTAQEWVGKLMEMRATPGKTGLKITRKDALERAEKEFSGELEVMVKREINMRYNEERQAIDDADNRDMENYTTKITTKGWITPLTAARGGKGSMIPHAEWDRMSTRVREVLQKTEMSHRQLMYAKGWRENYLKLSFMPASELKKMTLSHLYDVIAGFPTTEYKEMIRYKKEVDIGDLSGSISRTRLREAYEVRALPLIDFGDGKSEDTKRAKNQLAWGWEKFYSRVSTMKPKPNESEYGRIADEVLSETTTVDAPLGFWGSLFSPGSTVAPNLLSVFGLFGIGDPEQIEVPSAFMPPEEFIEVATPAPMGSISDEDKAAIKKKILDLREDMRGKPIPERLIGLVKRAHVSDQGYAAYEIIMGWGRE